ncbi:MAG: IRE (iron responsive element), partial [Planctomyces sp.]
MNNLTSRQRKLAYAAGILLLLFPIVILGAPAAKDVGVDDKSLSGGSGLLARMRVEHDLGEATLGNVDPSSAAMNLVLLGLRGPAAGLLHLQAIDYQERKDWAKLAATVDSITLLQPHYVQIWKFQG